MTGIQLGKIRKVTFGNYEYLFGLFLDLGGDGWGVSAEYCYNHCYMPKNQLGEQDKIDDELTMISKIQLLLSDAKVETIDQLIGKPVEVTFEGNLIRSFRILTEVL